MPHRLNLRIAARLREMGDLLEHQGGARFRAAAYRQAAQVVEQLREPIDAILAAEGRQGLVALPAVGKSIASAIGEMVASGRWSELDRLTGRLDPESLLMTIPGIGARLARRLHHDLHIDTLEDLERATTSGKFAADSGLGERRSSAIRSAVHERLQLVRGHVRPAPGPGVKLVLGIDALYRKKAEANELKLIAPRRFNPLGLAWLPVMHAHHKPWHFTALFSNTARAHQVNKSRDWVIVFAAHDNQPDWQCTVVTETRGALKGRRVVRGLEAECERFYAREMADQPSR